MLLLLIVLAHLCIIICSVDIYPVLEPLMLALFHFEVKWLHSNFGWSGLLIS